MRSVGVGRILMMSVLLIGSPAHADANAAERIESYRTEFAKLQSLQREVPSWSMRSPYHDSIFRDSMQISLANKPLSTRFKATETASNNAIDKKINDKFNEAEVTGHGPVVSVVTEVGRTYVMIYLLSLVEILKAELHASHVEYRDLSADKLAKASGDAISYLIDSGEITTSILGSTSTNLVTHHAVSALNAAIASSEFRPLFRNFMQAMLSSFVTFVGWDFGTQLWIEAANLIELDGLDEEERTLVGDTHRLWSNVYKASSGLIDPKDPSAIKSQKVLKLMSENLARIILTDSELRVQWAYNTVRMRLMTGHFATLVGSMSAAAAVGTTIFPGGGTVVGLAGGMVGGVASIFIPEKNKKDVTHFLQKNWLQSLKSLDGNSTQELLNLKYDSEGVARLNPKRNPNPNPNRKTLTEKLGFQSSGTVYNLAEVLQQRESYRERIIDIHIQGMYSAKTERDATSTLIAVRHGEKIQAEGMRQSHERIDRLKEELKNLNTNLWTQSLWLQAAHLSLVGFYREEIDLFSHMIRERRVEPGTKASTIVENELRNAENMLSHFCTMGRSLRTVYYYDYDHELWTRLEKQISEICVTPKPEALKSYATLSDREKANYDQALIFLRVTYATRFREYAVAVARLRSAFSFETQNKPLGVR